MEAISTTQQKTVHPGAKNNHTYGRNHLKKQFNIKKQLHQSALCQKYTEKKRNI